jgi:hypothetical protein
MASIKIFIPPDHAQIKGFSKTNSLRNFIAQRLRFSSLFSDKATKVLAKNFGKF